MFLHFNGKTAILLLWSFRCFRMFLSLSPFFRVFPCFSMEKHGKTRKRLIPSIFSVPWELNRMSHCRNDKLAWENAMLRHLPLSSHTEQESANFTRHGPTFMAAVSLFELGFSKVLQRWIRLGLSSISRTGIEGSTDVPWPSNPHLKVAFVCRRWAGCGITLTLKIGWLEVGQAEHCFKAYTLGQNSRH